MPSSQVNGISHASMIIEHVVITSSLLTWIVMPFVTKLMSAWLQSADQPTSLKSDFVGVGVITGSLALMVVLFKWF